METVAEVDERSTFATDLGTTEFSSSAEKVLEGHLPPVQVCTLKFKNVIFKDITSINQLQILD